MMTTQACFLKLLPFRVSLLIASPPTPNLYTLQATPSRLSNLAWASRPLKALSTIPPPFAQLLTTSFACSNSLTLCTSHMSAATRNGLKRMMSLICLQDFPAATLSFLSAKLFPPSTTVHCLHLFLHNANLGAVLALTPSHSSPNLPLYLPAQFASAHLMTALHAASPIVQKHFRFIPFTANSNLQDRAPSSTSSLTPALSTGT